MKDARILVIEDEILVGLDIVDALEKATFGVVQHVATEREALQQIQSERWDAVVADANLNGDSIERVVTVLQQRAIPFVLVTGYERQDLPEAVRDVPLLSKPFSPAQLADCVSYLLARKYGAIRDA